MAARKFEDGALVRLKGKNPWYTGVYKVVKYDNNEWGYARGYYLTAVDPKTQRQPGGSTIFQASQLVRHIHVPKFENAQDVLKWLESDID